MRRRVAGRARVRGRPVRAQPLRPRRPGDDSSRTLSRSWTTPARAIARQRT